MPVPSYSSDREKALSRRLLTSAPMAGEKLLWRRSRFAIPIVYEEDSFSSIIRTACPLLTLAEALTSWVIGPPYATRVEDDKMRQRKIDDEARADGDGLGEPNRQQQNFRCKDQSSGVGDQSGNAG